MWPAFLPCLYMTLIDIVTSINLLLPPPPPNPFTHTHTHTHPHPHPHPTMYHPTSTPLFIPYLPPSNIGQNRPRSRSLPRSRPAQISFIGFRGRNIDYWTCLDLLLILPPYVRWRHDNSRAWLRLIATKCNCGTSLITIRCLINPSPAHSLMSPMGKEAYS